MVVGLFPISFPKREIAGLVELHAKLDLNSGYVTQVLPQLVLVGIGLGTAIAPAMSLATSGVAATDAGVASAAVNTLQQVGGCIGIALLSTMASGAATDYLSGRDPKDADVLAQAGLAGYSTAYWWSAAVFVTGLIVRPPPPPGCAPAERERRTCRAHVADQGSTAHRRAGHTCHPSAFSPAEHAGHGTAWTSAPADALVISGNGT